jgi:hypothetical protein
MALIKELLGQVRSELLFLEKDTQNKKKVFTVDKLTIEAHFIASDTSADDKGLDLRLVKIGTNTNYKSESVHKIILELNAFNESKPEGGMPEGIKSLLEKIRSSSMTDMIDIKNLEIEITKLLESNDGTHVKEAVEYVS